MKWLCKGKVLLCIRQDIFVFSEFYFDNSKENVNFAAMKKLFLTNLFALMAAFAIAVPVKRGQWRTITLADGSQVRVEAVGDEFCHFWRSAAGDTYIMKGNVFVKADVHELEGAAAEEREKVTTLRRARFVKYFGHEYGDVSNGKKKIPALKKLEGVKKGIVMLVEFADVHFTEEHTPEYYNQVLNVGGPAEKGYVGSVKQYFLDQSNDKFTVDFDVAPIVRLPESHEAYVDLEETDDSKPKKNYLPDIIRYTVDQLKSNPTYGWTSHDWAPYDWDNDGEIDMVFVLYAGYGQNTKDDDVTLIWPHESSIREKNPVVSGKVVSTYACTNEINWNFGNGDLESGIGTFCHEFSHCLGYPDLYDVDYNCESQGITAMDYWDLMDSGDGNGDGFVPCPFSIHERMTAGWITPKELEDNKEYSHLRPITEKDGGDSYIMTNPNNPNEMYIFEAIQNTGWASGLYRSKGLLVIHVDYNATAWTSNRVNCIQDPTINTISRCTYVPADGDFYPDRSSQIRGDLYPYKTVNSLELKWNTGDGEGNRDCPIKLRNIVVNDDNTVSFTTGEATAVESVLSEAQQASACYNLSGQKVGADYRGIVLKNGKKYLAK